MCVVNNKQRVGMYGGSFDPLHVGHVACIVKASTMVDKLYIVLSYSVIRDRIPYQERFKWLKQITADMPNIKIILSEDTSPTKHEYDWKSGTEDILSKIDEKLDVVFCGDEYKSSNVFRLLYPDSEIVYFERSSVPISSTEIFENPFYNWRFIPSVAKEYFVRKIVIIGTESCGKTTMVQNLAKIYNTEFVPEYGRQVCDEVGGAENMRELDFPKIVYGHKMLEFEKIKNANRLLFIDTESLVTKYYLNLYANPDNNDKLYEEATKFSKYRLIIMLEPTVKWVDDGTRLHGEEATRWKNHNNLRELFDKSGVSYELISSSTYSERLNEAMGLIRYYFNL